MRTPIPLTTTPRPRWAWDEFGAFLVCVLAVLSLAWLTVRAWDWEDANRAIQEAQEVQP